MCEAGGGGGERGGGRGGGGVERGKGRTHVDVLIKASGRWFVRLIAGINRGGGQEARGVLEAGRLEGGCAAEKLLLYLGEEDLTAGGGGLDAAGEQPRATRAADVGGLCEVVWVVENVGRGVGVEGERAVAGGADLNLLLGRVGLLLDVGRGVLRRHAGQRGR